MYFCGVCSIRRHRAEWSSSKLSWKTWAYRERRQKYLGTTVIRLHFQSKSSIWTQFLLLPKTRSLSEAFQEASPGPSALRHLSHGWYIPPVELDWNNIEYL